MADDEDNLNRNGLFDFTVFPTLETERLILREIIPSDAEALFRIRGDYEVTKYNIGTAYDRLELAVDLIAAMAQAYREEKEIRWGITLKAEDTVIGMCGYNYWIRRDARGSVGYDLARAYWGQGIMTEALGAVIRFGFRHMGLNRIEADADARNPASARVLAKAGFHQEGLQREQFYEDSSFNDLVLFALLRKDYKHK
jgi:[ribosomal protein S5]-alanine N-acetyltransferase